MSNASVLFSKFRGLRVLIAVIAASFVGFFAHDAAAAEKVKIGTLPFYSCALSVVAEELGYWKAAGLDVEIIRFAGGSEENQALLSGGIDFGMGVGAIPALALAARGAKIVVFAGEAYSDIAIPSDWLMVTDKSPVTDVKQLDGKPVAIHVKGTISHFLLETLSQRFQIRPIVLEIPASSQLAALKRGDVAAVMAQTPFPEQIKVEGGRYLYGFPNKDVVPYLATTVTVTTQKIAAERPDIVKKVALVSMRTARWMMANPERAKNIIALKLKYKPEVTKEIRAGVFKWGRNGLFLMPSIQWWGRKMISLGIIQDEPPYEKYFVTTVAEQAAKEIGFVPDPEFDAAKAVPMPR